jgi:hypothetical protein
MGSKGQALIETAIFLPFVLMAMMAIIYFSQYGVLQERAVQAVRYAALVSNDPNNTFMLESMYGELAREGAAASQSDPGYPSSGFACDSAGSGADLAAAAALYQQQTVPGALGTAAPAAPKYFQADTTPVGSCTPSKVFFLNGDLDLAASYMIVQAATISAKKTVPTILRGFIPAQQTVTATMTYTVPAAPAPMMYCSQAFGSLLAASFASLPEVVPNVLSTPYAQYPVAPANPTPRPGC